MTGKINIWKGKGYEFSEKSYFYDKIKDILGKANFNYTINLVNASIIGGIEYDGLITIGNTFYALNFKNRSGIITGEETGIWSCNGGAMFNNKNPIEQGEQQQIILDKSLDSILTNKNYNINTIICFSSEAKLDKNIVSYNNDGIIITTLDKIESIILSANPNTELDESILEKLGLEKEEEDKRHVTLENKERDEEFNQALNVDLKLNEIVQAGPGTGKTHFLIHKIVDKLIDIKKNRTQCNIIGKGIIAITFSKSAAEELEKRIYDELKSKIGSLFEMNDIIGKVGTIHSFCNDLLRKLHYFNTIGYSKSPVIIDDYKLSQIITSLGYNYKLEGMLGMVINKYDGNLTKFNNDEIYFTGNDYECDGKIIHELFGKVRDFLIKSNYLTHDFSLLFTLEMLSNKEYLEKFKELGYTDILVDEFQDVSHIQFEIIKSLKLKTTMVGDEHQAIYGFRGASNKSFKRAEEEYNKVEKRYLTYNSRSGTNIVDKINKFLENYKQLPEGINTDAFTLKAYKVEAGTFSIDLFDSTYNLNKAIVNKIEDLIFNKKVKPSEIAILSRSKITDETRAIANALRDKGIICNYKPRILIEDPFVREIFNFLDLVYNPNHMDMWQLIGIEKRLYGQDNITKAIPREKIIGVKDVIEYITNNNLDPKGEIYKLLCIINADTLEMSLSNILLTYYNKIFLQHVNFNEKINIGHYQLLISKLFTICEDVAQGDFSVFSEQIQSIEFIDTNKNGIQCMSIHGSKGLQREYVFLLGMYKGTYPSPRAELVDELNVGYVGISRAKKCLYIPYAKLNKNYKPCDLSEEIGILNEKTNEISELIEPTRSSGTCEIRDGFFYVYGENNNIRKFQILNKETEEIIKTQLEIFGDDNIELILEDSVIKNFILEVKRDIEKENAELRSENLKIKNDLNEKINKQSNEIEELLKVVAENEKAINEAEIEKEVAEAQKFEAELKYRQALNDLEIAKNNGNDSLIEQAQKELDKATEGKKQAEILAKNRAQVIIDLQEKIDTMSSMIVTLKEDNCKVKSQANQEIAIIKKQKEEAEERYQEALKEIEKAQTSGDFNSIDEATEKLNLASENIKKLEKEVENKNGKLESLEEKIKELEEQLGKESQKNEENNGNKAYIFKAGEAEKICEFLIKLVEKANKSVMIIEPYMDSATFNLMYHRRIGVKGVIAYERKKTIYQQGIDGDPAKLAELLKLKEDQEGNPIAVRTLSNLHDRFIIVDDVVWQIGTSLNSTLGEKSTTIQKLSNSKEEILEAHRDGYSTSKHYSIG